MNNLQSQTFLTNNEIQILKELLHSLQPQSSNYENTNIRIYNSACSRQYNETKRIVYVGSNISFSVNNNLGYGRALLLFDIQNGFFQSCVYMKEYSPTNSVYAKDLDNSTFLAETREKATYKIISLNDLQTLVLLIPSAIENEKSHFWLYKTIQK